MAAKAEISRKRVFYEQPSGVKPQLRRLYIDTAAELDIPPASLRALGVVETDEKPFTPSGAPTPRLEIAYWKRFRLASRAAVGFDRATNSRDLDMRWVQFEAMRAVQEIPAILCHSFGLFQIMGFNYRACLCADPVIFLAESMSLDGQFRMVKRLIQSSPDLHGALRRQDAQQVGFHFNGRNYRQNQYDVKWAAAVKAGGKGVWT
jgi:hypothetical protein